MTNPPVTQKRSHKLLFGDHERTDHYYWLRDDERQDEAVLSHLAKENAYTKAMLANTETLQEKIFQEITGRFQQDEASVPHKRGDYWYVSRFITGEDFQAHYRKVTENAAEEQLILDENVAAKDHKYFMCAGWSVSPNNEFVAYSADVGGRNLFDIKIKNIASGDYFEEVITGTNGEIAWGNDSDSLFYVKRDPETLLACQVMRHKPGTPQEQDVLVYEEKDKSFTTFLGKTRDESTLVITHHSTITKGCSILSADTPYDAFTPFTAQEAHHEYSVQRLGDHFYIRTNDNAPEFRMMKVPVAQCHDRSQWQALTDASDDVFIKDFTVLSHFLVVHERVKGQTRVRTISLIDGTSTPIEFAEDDYVVWLQDNYDVNHTAVRLFYTSLTTPFTVYDIDLASGDKTIKQREKIFGDFEPENYACERVHIAARDGTQVPVSVVYRKSEFKADGSNPLFITGYGAYGSTTDPIFRPDRLSLLDRGFVHAIAHIRGGSMLGQQWYEGGKLMNKKNSFYDFIDVTEGLISRGYADKTQVFAEGVSAGGLLMGGCVNLAPDLFKGVMAHVPFVDLLTTICDPTIPLTTNEYNEWGDPDNAEAYEYMLSYSPYDNVSAQAYPHLLVTTGLHDSQVQYYEPTKWVAKLREFNTSDNPILLSVNMDGGHFGEAGRFGPYKLLAQSYAFVFQLMGITE